MKSTVKWTLLMLFLVAAFVPPVQAEVPFLLAWQGVALDSNSVPVTDSTYGFTFRIYDDGIGGNLLWQESQLVNTENGVLNVLLGTNNPVPDSVFNGPTCYLEVQFGAEPPYTPRTQIVSVGYAYRTSSVEGASGGTITGRVRVVGDIDIKADSSVSGLYLRQQFSSTLGGGLSVTPNGGSLSLYDSNGNKHTDITPDPADGAGGWFVVYGDDSFTRGVEIFDPSSSPSQNNPAMFIIGDSSSMYFNSNTVGDASVQLPSSSINAAEMFNEPGIAAGSQGAGIVYTSLDTAASATINFPASGYAVVICEATFRAYVANNFITCNLLQNGTNQSTWYWDPGDVDSPNPWYDQRQTYVFTKSVSGGTNTYILRFYMNSDSARYEDAKVTVMYFPTSYGSVASPTMTINPNDPGAGQIDQPTSATVDVEADRQEAIRINQDRIESELAAMKERMAELEAQLRSTATAASDRR